MQNIEFIDIHLENVGVHREMYIQFKNNCLAGIVGDNGSGKSTIFKALMIGLYGDTGEKGNSLNISDIVNKKNKDNLSIITRFKIDSDLFEIRKYQNHKEHRNKTILLQNNEDVSGKSVTETHQKIENLLVPIDIFRNTVYFSQQIKDFFTALTNADQWKIFNAIFSFEEWQKRQEHSDKMLKKVTPVYEKVSSDLSRLQIAIPEKLKYIERLHQIQKDEATRLKEEIGELKFLITDIEIEIKKLKKERDSIDFDETIYNQVIELLTREKAAKFDLERSILSEEEKITTKCNSEVERLKLEAKTVFNDASQKIKDRYKLKIDSLNSLISDLNKEAALKKQKFNDELLSLSNQKSKELLESNKNLQRFKSSQAEISSSIDSMEKEVEKLTNKIASIIRERESIETSTDPICDKCGQSVSGKSKTKILKGLIEDLNKNETKKKEVEEGIDILKNEYHKLDEPIQKAETEINRISKSYDSKTKDVQSQLDYLNSTLSGDIKQLEGEITSVQDKMEYEIVDAKEGVTIDYKQKINEQILNKNRDLDDLKTKSDSNRAELEKGINKFQNQKDSLDLQKNKHYNIITSISSFEKDIISKQSRIKDLESKKFDVSEIKSNEKELSFLNSEASKLIDKKNDAEELLEIIKFWKEGFSDRGIKSMLVDGAIPYLNKDVREELDKLAPGKFILTFDTMGFTKGGKTTDKFSVNVLNTESGADSHKLLSGGEKRIIDVCTLMGLRKLTESIHNKKFNILLLDEVLDSLDKRNTSQYLQILKKVASELSVTIITHNDNVTGYCDELYQL